MASDPILTRAQAAEEAEEAGTNLSANDTIGDVIAARFGRRDLVNGILAAGAIAATVSPLAISVAEKAAAQGANTTPSLTSRKSPPAPTTRSTSRMAMTPQATGRADGVCAIETEGPARGTSKLFFRCPNGADHPPAWPGSGKPPLHSMAG